MKAFLTIAVLQFLALVTPGPDFAMLMKNAILYTRRIALYTALGISLGIMVHTSYCILGLAWIINHSLTVFTIIKCLGAGYLIYIGVKALLAKRVVANAAATLQNTQLTDLQAIKQGFFCNVLNPKAGLFFIGLFTLVVNPTTPLAIQAFYGMWMVSVTFIWFALLALMITHAHFRQPIQHAQFWISKLMGALLFIFGLRLLFWHHS